MSGFDRWNGFGFEFYSVAGWWAKVTASRWVSMKLYCLWLIINVPQFYTVILFTDNFKTWEPFSTARHLRLVIANQNLKLTDYVICACRIGLHQPPLPPPKKKFWQLTKLWTFLSLLIEPFLILMATHWWRTHPSFDCKLIWSGAKWHQIKTVTAHTSYLLTWSLYEVTSV